jgi:hypothetical protein
MVGSLDLIVGLRASSLTQLIARFRNQAGAVQGAIATSAYRLSSSVSPNLSSYYWRINNQIIPQKPVYLVNGSLVGTGAEAFAEISKAFHAIGSVICNGSITYNMYNVACSAIGAFSTPFSVTSAGAGINVGAFSTYANAFSISTELETFSNRTDTILCGIDTLNSPLYLSLNIGTAIPANTSITVDIFAQMDVILEIQNGQMIAKW